MDGTRRKVDTHSIVGKCHCAAHKGYLTVKLLHRHECVEKGCFRVNYVSDGAYNDWSAYFSLAYEIGRRFGGKYLLLNIPPKTEQRRDTGGILS